MKSIIKEQKKSMDYNTKFNKDLMAQRKIVKHILRRNPLFFEDNARQIL